MQMMTMLQVGIDVDDMMTMLQVGIDVDEMTVVGGNVVCRY